MNLSLRKFAVGALVGFAAGIATPAFASDITLTLLPGSSISGEVGTTVGFGFELTNNTSFYYQPLDLNASPFTVGDPLPIFDFPELAPDSSLTETFETAPSATCSFPDCGLYEIALTSRGTNSGTFSIDGEFYADASEFTDSGSAPVASACYTVASVPEPASAPLIALLLGGIALVYSRRNRLARSK